MSSHGSSSISLFHATTYEHLLDVSVTQAVAQKLQGKFLPVHILGAGTSGSRGPWGPWGPGPLAPNASATQST